MITDQLLAKYPIISDQVDAKELGALLRELEKVLQSRTSVVNLYGRNAFLPTTVDNQLVSQGFFSEIRTFADKVEHQSKKRKSSASDLECIQDTYWLISEIREYLDKK